MSIAAAPVNPTAANCRSTAAAVVPTLAAEILFCEGAAGAGSRKSTIASLPPGCTLCSSNSSNNRYTRSSVSLQARNT
eukprot:12691-Heterococcus_DN1.PRE.1